MKRILCYGDSNTWGQKAFEETQILEVNQWPIILGQLLGADYKVISEGLPARIAGDYEKSDDKRNGKKDFKFTYKKCSPVHLTIIALGTNDLKSRYKRSAQDIVSDLVWYGETVAQLEQASAAAISKTIYVAPPNFSNDCIDANDSLRLEVIKLLEETAENLLVFNDLELSDDGVHLSIADHRRLAKELYYKVVSIEDQLKLMEKSL